MWRITREVLKWYAGEYTDDAEAKAAIFAAIKQARAVHIPQAAPVVC